MEYLYGKEREEEIRKWRRVVVRDRIVEGVSAVLLMGLLILFVKVWFAVEGFHIQW